MTNNCEFRTPMDIFQSKIFRPQVSLFEDTHSYWKYRVIFWWLLIKWHISWQKSNWNNLRDIIRGNGIFWLAQTKFKEIKYSLCDNIVIEMKYFARWVTKFEILIIEVFVCCLTKVLMKLNIFPTVWRNSMKWNTLLAPGSHPLRNVTKL